MAAFILFILLTSQLIHFSFASLEPIHSIVIMTPMLEVRHQFNSPILPEVLKVLAFFEEEVCNPFLQVSFLLLSIPLESQHFLNKESNGYCCSLSIQKRTCHVLAHLLLFYIKPLVMVDLVIGVSLENNELVNPSLLFCYQM